MINLTQKGVVVDCEWGNFGDWSSCSQTCGGGEKSRTRSRKTQPENGGNPCIGEETEKQTCNPDTCPG